MGSSEKSIAYRQVFINFANAEDIESACLGILNDIKEVFDFPDDFSENAKKAFPRMSELISVLTKVEKEFIHSIYQNMDLWWIFHILNFGSRSIAVSYDSDKEVFECINRNDNSISEVKAEKLVGRFGADLEKIDIAAKLLNKLNTIFTKEICLKIKRPFWAVIQILGNYNSVYCDREMLISTLDHIAVGKNLYKCKSFNQILDMRSEYWISYLELHPDGSLTWRELFTIEKDPEFYSCNRYTDIDKFGLAAQSCLVQCLLEFPKSLELINKCPHCNKFFSAKDKKRKTRCYSRECDKEYQRQKKRKQREEDPVSYL